jgi:hypothetical protein
MSNVRFHRYREIIAKTEDDFMAADADLLQLGSNEECQICFVRKSVHNLAQKKNSSASIARHSQSVPANAQ